MYLNVKRSIKTKDVGKLKPLMSMLNQLIGLHTLAPNQSQMARALVRSAIKSVMTIHVLTLLQEFVTPLTTSITTK